VTKGLVGGNGKDMGRDGDAVSGGERLVQGHDGVVGIVAWEISREKVVEDLGDSGS
jgi:hypothetical protein